MISEAEQVSRFGNVSCVVADSLRFRQKLAIGEDAYTSLRLGKTLAQIWDVGGVAATGAQIAAMPAVAAKFFTNGGILAALGIGSTAAVTPIGWIIAASVVTGGAYYGVTRLFRSYSGTRVEVIPKFINTPIDLLAASLLDLIASLSIKVALMDGVFTEDERSVVRDHFVGQWGYDPTYVDQALTVIEENIEKSSLTQMIESFSAFALANPDCNFAMMRKELVVFLTEVALADGRLDEREEMAIERVERMMSSPSKKLPKLPQVPKIPSLGDLASGPAYTAGKISGKSMKLFKK
jgi:uncharacterized tellurite resistance protein B-like protein